MRKMHLLWIATCAMIGLNACATLQPKQLDTAKACADWRWIGVSRPGGRCPEVPGWTTHPLFPQAAPVQLPPEISCTSEDLKDKIRSLQVTRELNRFCVYEIADWKKRLSKVPFPPTARPGLVRFDKDCAAISPPAPLDPKQRTLEPDSEFLRQVGVAPKALNIQNQGGVRLAFLDTQPTSEIFPAEPGNSSHGYILANIARDLVCTQPNGHCAAQITTQLALPILKFDPEKPKLNKIDTVRGGALGMQSDLATAIYNEVASWQLHKDTQQHLVLNLSLAWDGKLFDGLDQQQISNMQAGTQAVYWALQYAADLDVLVLAAAGNRKSAPCVNRGMLLPAAWETQPPQEEICPGTEQEWQPPIVYGIGGLNAHRQPLLNALPDGMPRRAAYGERIFAGSSVATAVASSIAALVWDSFPQLKAQEVMNLLFDAGEKLESPSVSRLSLCHALKKACADHPGLPCPLQSGCNSWPGPGQQPALPTFEGSCQPWLYPQPEDPPFPNCCPGGR